jgi:hypothetical protein
VFQGLFQHGFQEMSVAAPGLGHARAFSQDFGRIVASAVERGGFEPNSSFFFPAFWPLQFRNLLCAA